MTLEWLNWVGIAGGIASILGLFIAFAVLRRGERRKLLTWDRSFPFPLASAFPEREDYQLSIVYDRPGSEPMKVTGVALQFARLANLGREPIRRADLAPSDPLRLEVKGARVLDISTARVTRDVIGIRASAFEEEEEKGTTTSHLSFDFLDYRDGAVIRVLTEGEEGKARVLGSVVGMPEGICRVEEGRQSIIRTAVTVGLLVVFYVGAIAASVFVFHAFIEDWALLWVLLVPIGALILPIVPALLLDAVWPSGVRWPSAMRFHGWFPHELVLGEFGPRLVTHARLEDEVEAGKPRAADR